MKRRDDYQNDLATVERAIGASAAKKEANRAEIALGRSGGLKGGKAGAEALAPEQRKAIGQPPASPNAGKPA
jgi:hypothetical protein